LKIVKLFPYLIRGDRKTEKIRKHLTPIAIEDAGDAIPAESEQARKAYLDRLLVNIAESVIRCGDDSGVKYKAIFVGYKTEWIPEGYVGCALTCAPYVVLARDALPEGGTDRLLEISVSEWEKALHLPPLK